MKGVRVRPAYAAMIVAGLVTALVFAPGLSDEFIWDDWPLIVRNQFVRDPSHLLDVLTRPLWDVSSRGGVGRLAYLNLYRPVVSLAYASQFQLFGEDPFGYHLLSLVLHVACVLCALAWLRQRLASTSSAAWIAAAVGVVPFALHPSRPETVTWVSGCTDLWMTFWALLGVLALAQERTLVRVAGAGALALAVLSKEAAVVVPVLLVADAVLVEGRRPELRREGLAVLGVVVAIAVHVVAVPPVSGAEMARSGMFERVLATLGHFVGRTLWGFSPSVEPVPRIYDAARHEVFAPWSLALGAALLGAVVILAVLARRRASLRPWLADALWYLLPLLPVSNVLSLSGPTLVAERYLFMPLLGVGALLARAALPRVAAGPPSRTVVLGAAALLAVTYGAISSRHTLDFETDSALWDYELERNPDALSAITSVGAEAAEDGDVSRATSLWLHGRSVSLARHDPEQAALYVLFIVNALVGVSSDAEQERLRTFRDFYDRLISEGHLQIAIPEVQVDESLPDDIVVRLRRSVEFVYLPRAQTYARTGELVEAERQLAAILQLDPRSAGAWVLRIAVAARRGEWEAARAALARARGSLPGDPTVEGMGQALERAYGLAQQPAPDPVAVAVRDARVQYELGAPETARGILDAALAAYPGNPVLIMERARADVADARFDLARRVLEQARDDDPGNAAQWDVALQRLAAAEAESARRRRARAAH